MLGAIAGVMLLGGIAGSVVAVTVFGGAGTHATAQVPAQARRDPDMKSAFQKAFEASFKNSCRQSAMSSGRISQSLADTYCDCALSVIRETHSPTKAVSTCKQKIGR